MTTADFSFPLNVYARLLEVQEGGVEYLHFAVFDEPHEPVMLAQQRASDLLWQVLPGPCKLLEVGIGLGTTLARLKQRGFDATGISPEAAQIELARQRHGAELPLRCARLEDFSEAAGQWQALLLQESAQYIDPMALFTAAERLLVRGPAQLVVMDEFALDRREAGHQGLHHQLHFIALAGRFGWKLTHQADLSRAVWPTLDYLLQGVRAQRERLLAELGLSAAQMDELERALQRSRSLYHAGVYGYALLRFERAEAPVEVPVALGSADSGEVRELFQHVFGHALSAAEWDWKYGASRGVALGLRSEGRLLAHYGGLSRRVLQCGEPTQACQVCDVMVHPQLRRSLGRQGPLHRLTASFLESHIGWGRAHRLGFGFPTERAFAAAERLGLYESVDQMHCLRWPALARSGATRLQDIDAAALAAGSATAAEVEGLWAAMAASLPDVILGVRDAAWLRHRYLGHPRFRYRLLLVRSRWLRRPVGVLVLREHGEHLEWVDWVAPVAAWPTLLVVARGQAVALNLGALEAWITASQMHRLAALDPSGVSRSLGIEVPSNRHGPGPGAEQLRGRWLLTAGDTDFR